MTRPFSGTFRFAIVAAVVAGSIILGTTATRLDGQTPQTSPGDQAAPRQVPSFRAGIDVVSLNVTVTDGTARYLTDLQDNDFSVFEDGVK